MQYSSLQYEIEFAKISMSEAKANSKRRETKMTRKEIIRNAYDFEIEAIENDDLSKNPYFDMIKEFEDGDEIWEAINVAIEMKYGRW